MKISKIIFSFLLLVGFFMPWVDAMFTTISGFSLPSTLNNANELFGGAGGNLGYLYLLYLAPLAAIASIALSFANKSVKITGVLAGAIPLLFFGIAYSEIGSMVSEGLAAGSYLTILASLGCIFTAFSEPKNLEVEKNTPQKQQT